MGGGEDDKKRGMSSSGHQHHPPPPSAPEYGTFQGVANYPPPPPHGVFPQPVPPPGATDPPPQYYAHGYQSTVPGYAVAEGRPVRERRLPCCGLGLGWCLFIIGFFLAAIPWYVGDRLPRETRIYRLHSCCYSCYNRYCPWCHKGK
ncbi:hypothetical protein ACLB2K_025683 [Fragaria x ananassa]